ncbi:MAG: Nif3-like dinuclear metal center hexameric protein [Bacteroidota bacterium]
MTVTEVGKLLNALSPLHYAEDFDNVGLLVGHPETEVNGILVTLDTLEEVVDEAIAKECNLIISFHPIIFSGLKKLVGNTYVERVVMKAIANNIAIFAIHTALDNSHLGVNAKICEVLGIKNPKILIPKKGTIKKLITYVPTAGAENLRSALFKAGAGDIGNYTNCSFNIEGLGSFNPSEKSNPTVGEKGKIHFEKEIQLNITFESVKEGEVLNALFKEHPYEEVAYEITTLDNTNQNIGMGMIGTLERPMKEEDFLSMLKKRMRSPIVRHSQLLNKKIERVAVLGGSGAFAINAAKRAKADIYVTADVKYHQFFEAENRLLIADIGHFETEQFTKNLLADFLKEKIPNFAVTLSESKTNPIKYF